MKKAMVLLGLMGCLLGLFQPGAFARDGDPGGDGGYKPPPYYTPQTAQVPPSYTYTAIPKPPISSYTSAPGSVTVQNYGSDTPLNNSISTGITNTTTYNSSSVPVSYTPVTSSSAWVPKPVTTAAPQPAANPDSQEAQE